MIRKLCRYDLLLIPPRSGGWFFLSKSTKGVIYWNPQLWGEMAPSVPFINLYDMLKPKYLFYVFMFGTEINYSIDWLIENSISWKAISLMQMPVLWLSKYASPKFSLYRLYNNRSNLISFGLLLKYCTLQHEPKEGLNATIRKHMPLTG